MMHRVDRWGAVLAVAGLLGAFIPAGPATAEPTPDFSLLVTPTRVIVPVGDRLHESTVEVRNQGRHPTEVVVMKKDVEVDPSGTLRLVDHAPYSAMEWVTVTPHQFLLQPGQRKQVTVKVDLPADPEPGDHHVGLVFVSPSGESDGNIRINRGIGIPVYVEVPGIVDRSVQLLGFTAPRFAVRGPVTFSAALRHTGTAHRDFRGDRRLAVEVAGRQLDVPDFTVMRGATRELTVQWDDPPWFCLCKATLTVPDLNGRMQRQSVEVVIVPLHLIGAALALLTSAAIVYVGWRRGVWHSAWVGLLRLRRRR